MSTKKWLLIGCGGCSVVLLIIAIVVGSGVWWVSSRVGEFMDIATQLEDNQLELSQQYPFTAPEDGVIDPARFEQYMQVREAMITTTNEKLGWMISFISEEAPMAEPGISDWITLPFTFVSLGKEHTDELFSIQMSTEEYSFITKQMMAEILTWKDDGATAEKQQFAEQYFAILMTMNQQIQEVEQENPAANINIGPFTWSQVEGILNGVNVEGHPNEELVVQHMDEIGSDDAAVLFDTFSLEIELQHLEQNWQQ